MSPVSVRKFPGWMPRCWPAASRWEKSPHQFGCPMTENKLREVIEASEALIGIVMALEGCSREDALRILRQAEIVAYRSAISPDSTDTLH